MKKVTYSFGIISACVILFIIINSNYQQNSGRVFEKDEIAPDIELTNPKGKKNKALKIKG